MTKQITVKDQIKGTLTNMSGQFKAALPPHINVDKFVRVAQTAILTNPSISKLEKNSLYKSCIEAAQAGLLPDGKEGAIVPFKGSATFMPMVAGILKKIRNSGQLASITAQIVCENDDFEFWIDDNGENLKHRPNMFEDRGKEIGVYALAKTKDGGIYIEVLTEKDIAAIRSMSKGSNGPWSGPFAGEMKKKSAIRRLAKRLPMSTDLEGIVQADDKFYDVEKQPPTEVQNEMAPKKSKLEAIVGVAEEPVQETAPQPEQAIEVESKQTTPEVL